MAKFTDADVKELAALMHKSDKGIAFLTGAGCSISAGIPTALQLVEEINKEYADTVRHLDASKHDDYGACMSILSLAERERLIKPYLEKAKINWAHVALATLIERKLISRVLTFNFDSILAHACGLLGIYPATYDFGVSPSDRTDYLAHPSIIHLHGQGYGPVMMNSDAETQEHAEKLSPLLTNTLESYPLIVVGYSGEADKVFAKLTSLYKGRHRLYWLGFSEEPKAHLRAFLDGKHGKLIHYIGGADADQILIQLAQQLNCFPPQVFANPASNLLYEMEKIADFPLEKTNFKTDILKKSRSKLNHKQTRDALRLDAVDLAVLSNKPEDVPKTGDAGFEEVPPEIQAWALIKRGNEHFDAAKKANSISEFEKSVHQYEAALKIKPDMHEAYYNLGNALSDLAQLKQEPAMFEASFAKFKAALEVKPDYYKALNNWGIELTRLALLKQEPALFEASFVKFEAALKIKPDYHIAFGSWGIALSFLAHLKQEPTLFNASFVKFEAALKIKPDYYVALNSLGSALIDAWRLTKDEKYLGKAVVVTGKAEKLDPSKCFKGACLAAIKNDEEGCKERLFRAKAAKTLPSRKHLEEDVDFANMRDKHWFAELLEGL